MTEEEAKTKFCFKAATFAGSQQIADGPGPFCAGSGCMAWRWAYGPVPNQSPGGGIVRMQKDGGYCGIAGEPTP